MALVVLVAIDAEGVKKKRKKKVYVLDTLASIHGGCGCGCRQHCAEGAGDCRHRVDVGAGGVLR